MVKELIPYADNSEIVEFLGRPIPAIIHSAGDNATRRFLEFFTAHIRNENTREAYGRAIMQFLVWADQHGWGLGQITAPIIASYIESDQRSTPTVKQHLAAIKQFFDWLVLGHVLESNPALSVRGPKYSVRKGKTPLVPQEENRQLFDSFDTSTVVGLRDRALVGVFYFTFARVSAVIGMKVEDYYPVGKRWRLRFHEKGGKEHEMPAHHQLEAFLDAYIQAAGIGAEKKSPLFRSSPGKARLLTDRAIHRVHAWQMIQRRFKDAGIEMRAGCHSFRATGMTTYLKNGGSLEVAQDMANHADVRTTRLYDRRDDEVTLSEVEKNRL